jgi:hypothetical protein
VNSPRFVVRQIDPIRQRRARAWAALAWLATLALSVAATLAWVGQRAADTPLAASATGDSDTLKSRIAVLERSEQVARSALVELQNTLRDREEEIAGVRADLAFYGRLVGGAKREGLAVHALRVEPVAGSRAWNVHVTLTQNFKRGPETKGRLTLSVSGVMAGKLETLDWGQLTQTADASGIDYAFKYFEQIEGTIMLPDGFEPNRVRAIAIGDGDRAEQELPWNEAAEAGESNNVRQ